MSAVSDIEGFQALCQAGTVRLQRVRPDANMYRRYAVSVGRDLFGAVVVTCRWGRTGCVGQVQEHVCTTWAEAEALALRLVARKLARGYAVEGAALAAGPPHPAEPRSQEKDERAQRRRCAQTQTQMCLFPASPAPVDSIVVQSPPAAAARTSAADPFVPAPVNSTMQTLRKPATRSDQEQALEMLTLAASVRGLSLTRGAAPRTLSMPFQGP
jgi:predicted DNA-binding WGR domain protein